MYRHINIDECEARPPCIPEGDCSEEWEAWEQKCVEIEEGIYMPRHEPVNASVGPVLALIPYSLLFVGAFFILLGSCRKRLTS